MEHNIHDYGAVTDQKLNTKQIQYAINACAPGDTVVIPEGTYRSGTLRLHANMTLHIDSGAVLQGSTEMKDYPDIGIQHNEFGPVHTLLYADESDNITLEGDGAIDFCGDSFMDFSKTINDTVDLTRLTAEQRLQVDVKPLNRPNVMVLFKHSDHVRVTGLHFLNPAC